MPTFQSGNAELNFEDTGGDDMPIVLVHGFATNLTENWKRTGWCSAFEAKRRRVVAMDNRGHGESQKFYDPEDYGGEVLVDDVLALLDHLNVERADLMGYSMGARISLGCVLKDGGRFETLILGGVGSSFFDRSSGPSQMASALMADDPESITDATARGFRIFAEQQGEDRKALAAFVKGAPFKIEEADLAMIRTPTLVVAGAHDDLAGNPQALADLIPGAKSVTLPGCDHMYAIPHGLYKASVMDFLEGWLE